MPIEIRKAGISSSRPCRYCLGLQDDGVFADFDVDEWGRVFLVAISFDGYGFCRTAESIQLMSLDRSKRFMSLVENDNVVSEELRTIISEYFRENSDVIWKDALEDHALIGD